MKLSPWLLVGGAVAAYFLFFSKKAPSAAPRVASGSSSNGGEARSGWDFAGKLADQAAHLAEKAMEASGTDGMAPASISGVVGAAGGFNGLGGSFYGSY